MPRSRRSVEIFRAGEIGVEMRLLGDIAEQRLVGLKVRKRILAVELNAPWDGSSSPIRNLDVVLLPDPFGRAIRALPPDGLRTTRARCRQRPVTF